MTGEACPSWCDGSGHGPDDMAVHTSAETTVGPVRVSLDRYDRRGVTGDVGVYVSDYRLTVDEAERVIAELRHHVALARGAVLAVTR